MYMHVLLPNFAIGIAWSWIGEGFEKPILARASCIVLDSNSVSKETLSSTATSSVLKRGWLEAMTGTGGQKKKRRGSSHSGRRTKAEATNGEQLNLIGVF